MPVHHHHHHHHITPPPPPPLFGSFISEAQQVHTTHTHTQLIHYQHYCCCMGVFNTTYSSHQPKKNRKERWGWEGWLITYWLCCAAQQNKTKNSKTIWENLQLKQTNGWLENKERVESEIKRAFFTTTVIRQLWVPYWGLQPTFASIVCMYVCMYVCMCVCVCFSQIFLEGLT